MCCRLLYRLLHTLPCCKLVSAYQMYVMLDAVADGGVYAGVPKDLALKLMAHTMMVANFLAFSNYNY